MGIFRQVAVFLALALWLGCGPAHAEKRVALVIGNSAYRNVPPLTNPSNDAKMVAAMLKQAGFDTVTTRLDLDAAEMRKSLREFGAQSRNADVAVIYYAGHGIELDGNNFLIPTDASLETDTDVLDETIALDRALFAVEPARQLRLIILDACRDNPFVKTMKRTVASRGISRGLAKVEPNSPNTMIAFAAKAGSVASDGDSGNSPFASALVKYLPRPGLDLRKAFGFVRDDVLKKTDFAQEPYVYGSLGGEDVPLVPAKSDSAGSGSSANPQEAARRDYELAIQLGTRDAWNAFLAQYPDGYYASLAKGQLNKIAAEEARVAAAEKARLAEQDRARLVAEGASQADQERAVEKAKATAEAQAAAEKAKQVEQAKAEAAERTRLAAEKAAAEQKAQVASLSPPVDKQDQPPDLVRALQAELRRVGCNVGAVDGDWDAASQRALALFNKHAGLKLEITVPSSDALDAVKHMSLRVCPLICDHGYKVDGEACVKIVCRSGYRLAADNTCERIQADRSQKKRENAPRLEQPKTASSGSDSQRQIVCEQSGCRTVRPGCRAAQAPAWAGGMHIGEVCH